MSNVPELIFLGLQEKKGCENCPFKHRKTQTIAFEGNFEADLMIVGRSPGGEEDRVGRPFVGPGGKALDRFLLAAGINRLQTFITNTAKCYGGIGDPPPTEEVYDVCEPFIQKEILLVQPKLIVTLGNDALRRLTQETTSSAVLQGTIQTFRHLPDKEFFPISHPGFWVRRGNYLQDVIIKEIAPKLKQACEERNIKFAPVPDLIDQLSTENPNG